MPIAFAMTIIAVIFVANAIRLSTCTIGGIEQPIENRRRVPQELKRLLLANADQPHDAEAKRHGADEDD